jgi:molybdenum cofactor sulfurtransferase
MGCGASQDAAVTASTDRASGATDPPPDWPAIERLRATEYARLDADGHAYLDYTGGGLYADSQLRAHQALLADGTFGNPHSTSPSSRASTRLADSARQAILRFLGAPPDEYVVIFTANATAALKLVGEAYPFAPDGRFVLTADDHNSVNGIREFARARGADVTYIPIRPNDLRADEDRVREILAGPRTRRHADGRTPRPGLFAYPAQSNYSGVRHPLAWIDLAHEHGWDVLLDASAYVPTNELDLSRWHPDFVVVSWYKVFGYPTGVGSLVVRREALARLQRPWFAGGSIGVASVVRSRHTLGPDEVGFEDGTIDYLSLPAVEIGIRYLTSVGLPIIHGRVDALTRWLLDGLIAMQHPDGAPMVRLYGPSDAVDRGGTIPFNVLDRTGGLLDFWDVEQRASTRGVSIRTGCFCNPGASEAARGITAEEMDRVFALDHHPTVDDLRRLLPGKALGAIRASVGIVTTERDGRRLLDLIDELADAPVSAIRDPAA